jgi:SAM-dependent methyltransferase
MKKKSSSTSWESVSRWYDESVGKTGHYYHEHVILPKLLPLIQGEEALLDLACGQGILSKHLSPKRSYLGVDLSNSLIRSAKEQNTNKLHTFLVSDITIPFTLPKKDFSFCTIVLAIQNLKNPLGALKNAFQHMKSDSRLVIVMNHPCFRIPRQSSWGIDSDKKIQYRRIDRYMSALQIPIQSHPSKGETSEQTLSFHAPISSWSLWLKEAGFAIEWMEEWCSDKKSTGKCAKMEDTSRNEFPMFLCIVAKRSIS